MKNTKVYCDVKELRFLSRMKKKILITTRIVNTHSLVWSRERESTCCCMLNHHFARIITSAPFKNHAETKKNANTVESVNCLTPELITVRNQDECSGCVWRWGD